MSPSRFTPGKPVLLILTSDLQTRAGPQPVECTVTECARKRVRVAVPSDGAERLLREVKRQRAAGAPATARLDLSFRDSTTERQLGALKALGNVCDASNEYEVCSISEILCNVALLGNACNVAEFDREALCISV